MRLLLIGTLLLVASLSACDQAGDTQKAETSQVAQSASPAEIASPEPQVGKIDRSHAGQSAPTAIFQTRGGKTFRISDFVGTPVVVNLWATWCGPCVIEMPALDRLAAREKGKLTVLTVSQDMGGWRAIDGFFKPGRFKALVPYLDQPNALPLTLGAQGLPMTVVYDAKGRELWRVNGPLKWDGSEVAALLAEKPAVKDPWAAAKARGIEFRAVGNEPGWLLEIDSGKTMTMIADYGERTATLPAPKQVRPADRAQYAIASSGHGLGVSIHKTECNDGMSDRRYPYTVEVKFDNRSYKGCGQYL